MNVPIAHITTEKPAGEPSRTDRLMARVAEHIATLEPAERAPWLRRQVGVWIRAYERWAYEIDAGHEEPSGATADDFLETISALNRLERACEASS